MSKFFRDVGEVVAEPFKTAYNVVTNNPKGNSIGDVWNNSFGDGNPIQNFIHDMPDVSILRKANLGDWSKLAQAPSWDTMQTPLAAFSERVDTVNKVLPEVVQPYAVPVETAALGLVNPFLGASFNTAYNAGNNQAQPGEFDWGKFGKDAAVNFGTAALASGANKLISNANKATAAKTYNPGPANFSEAATLKGGADIPNALDNFGQLGQSSATQGFANTASSTSSIPSLASSGVTSSLSSFQPSYNTSSTSTIPQASALQSSGNLGDKLYQAGVRTTQGVGSSALASTLAPVGAEPISGSTDNLSSSDASLYTPQYGDVLNAFGGEELNTPNANGYRIDDAAFQRMTDRLGANSYLQQSQARDSFIPAGQVEQEPNTPYSNRIKQINSGTQQSYKDLLDQKNNANKYYSLIDSNPGLTPEELDAFLRDKSSGTLGQFRVAPEQMGYFDNIRSLSPQNTSLVN